MALQLTKGNFDKTLDTSLPVLVDFWAPWCGPCKMLGPVVEEAAKKLENQAVVGKVCVDDEKELAQRFSVMSIPTIVVLKNGKEVDRSVGYIELDEVLALAKKHM
ncbi:MAG: thioredoxin [Treponema sp.]